MATFHNGLVRMRSSGRFLFQVNVVVIPLAWAYAFAEYYINLETETPEALVPLLIRVTAAGILIGSSAAIFEILFKDWLRKRPFLQVVLGRSLVYSLIITTWLSLINGIWHTIDQNVAFGEGVILYLFDKMYFINIVTIMVYVIK